MAINLSYEDAAHLLRRMAFGADPEEIDSFAGRTREKAVDRLLDYEEIDNQELEAQLLSDFNPKRWTPEEDVQLWWIIRMILTRRPFEEKMTLFWHNHFATALDKVDFDLMYVQNLTLRAHATDRFDDLLLAVARDPAMLIWLDGVTNVLGKPNENFARELKELFTMGVFDVVTGQPNYTERDVKEVARAFTGWQFEGSKKRYKYSFRIRPEQHDNGLKEIFGVRANFSGEDVIDILCQKRATGRFLVKRFFEAFVYPLSNSPEDIATIENFANVYFSTNHSIKELARAIFVSDEFFSQRARFGLIKTPAELVVGAIKMIGADYNPGNLKKGADFDLYFQFKRMGFDLLNPFDVSGWKLNLGWLNTATVLERYNFANELLSNRSEKNSVGSRITNEKLRRHTSPSAEQTVRNFLHILGPLNVGEDSVQLLTDYIQTDDNGRRIAWIVDENHIDKYVRGLVFLIMCLPEFQLN